MKRRTGHWLRGNATTTIPEHHFCIATTVVPSHDRDDCLELAGAGLVQCRWTAGKLETLHGGSAATAPELWKLVRDLLPQKCKTWIWLLQPRQDLPALQFTRLVETRKFKRQFWCWSDPPIIIDGSLFGRPVHMVGIENWLANPVAGDGLVDAQGGDVQPLGDAAEPDHCQTALDAASGLATIVGRLLHVVYREDLGHLKSTVGGQSMQSYRHQWLTGKIGCHNNSGALNLERSAPLGMPIDVKRPGVPHSNITVLDVNSLYPHVMRNYPYPRKLLWYSETVSIEDLQRASSTCLIIARCNVSDSFVRYLSKTPDGCKWLTGSNTLVLVGPDFDRALTSRAITEVFAAAAYEGVGLFCGWAEWVWQLRQRYKLEGDALGGQIVKMLSVALWGSFAKSLHRYIPAPELAVPQQYGMFTHHDADTGRSTRCRVIAGIVDRLDVAEEPEDSLPMLAAFVAAYARSYMAGLTAIAGAANVVYQVADALHVTTQGWFNLDNARLIHPGEMGKLKLVRRVANAEYLAANRYWHDGELTAAGLPVQSVQVEPGVVGWRSPDHLNQSVLAQPTGHVRAPERRQELPERPRTRLGIAAPRPQ